MPKLAQDEPPALALTQAIHAGDVNSLKALLREHPDLAAARLADRKGGSRTPLHVATDWPGFFPNGPEIVAVLIGAGGDPNAPAEGMWHTETPLHWAASSDDAEVAKALIDGGANIEAPEILATAPPTRQELTDAFWQACHGGQRRMAEHLLGLGAELNGTPSWGDDTPLDVADSMDTGRQALVTWLRSQGAKTSKAAS